MKISKKKIVIILIIAILGCFSATVLAQVYSSPEKNSATVQYLDKKENTVLTITAGAAVAATVIALVPGDSTNPVADKIMDLAGYMMIVLAAIFLEKYLVGILGLVAYRFIIPLACILLIIAIIKSHDKLLELGVKIVILAIIVSNLVPAGVWTSKMIEDTYQTNIDQMVEQAQNIEDTSAPAESASGTSDVAGTSESSGTSGTSEAAEAESKSTDKKATDSQAEASASTSSKSSASNETDSSKTTAKKKKSFASWFKKTKESAGDLLDWSKATAKDKLDDVQVLINRYIELIAVMLVTSFIIPIGILLLGLWVIRLLFGVDLTPTLSEARLSKLIKKARDTKDAEE